jgi:hypothetical protein
MLTVGGVAQAGFMGAQMNAGYYFPDSSSPYAPAVFTPSSFTVGAGQETVGDVEGVTNLLVDFSDDTLSIAFDTILGNPTWNTAIFNGVIFTATSPLDITSVVVDASTTMAGFDNFRVSYTDHQILLNWQGLSYIDGTIVNINFTSGLPQNGVPEPAPSRCWGLAWQGWHGAGTGSIGNSDSVLGLLERFSFTRFCRR